MRMIPIREPRNRFEDRAVGIVRHDDLTIIEHGRCQRDLNLCLQTVNDLFHLQAHEPQFGTVAGLAERTHFGERSIEVRKGDLIATSINNVARSVGGQAGEDSRILEGVAREADLI